MNKLVLTLIALTGFVFAQGCTCSKQDEQPAAVEGAPTDATTAPADGTTPPPADAPATAPTGH